MRNEINQKTRIIETLEDDVRKHINTTRYQNDLIKDGNTWDQICCSLDTIGDTIYAINDYINSEYPSEIGLKYIFTYGVLQALFIQQDAISHLSEAFCIQYSHSETLKNIRLLRNAAIGHPTKQALTPDRRTYYNYISRMTLRQKGFTLMRSHNQEKAEFVDVDLFSIIHDQLEEIAASYGVIAKKLKEADNMHKEKYKDDLLIDIFHSSMSYQFEKVAQAIHSPDPNNVSFGLSILHGIQKTYQEFESALKERGDINSSIQYELEEYKHALAKLEDYLSGNKSNMTERDARIYHYYARAQHRDFEKIAKEIDKSYKRS